jgi:hypothetical protein
MGCAALSALALAGRGFAGPLPYPTLVGSYNNPGLAGTIGFVGGVNADGSATAGQLGAAYGSVVTVNSITIDQFDDSTRHRMHDLRVYTSPTTFVPVTLADSQAPQTVTIPGGVTGDYFLITVESQYTTGGSTDANVGLNALSFDGTTIAPWTNFNAGIAPTATNALDPATFPLTATTNGQIQASGQSIDEAAFFDYTASTDRSLTVTYAGAQDVGSFGIGWETFAGVNGNLRAVPKFVTVSDSNGNSQQVTLDPHTLQFGQYALTTPFLGTTSLTVTLPVGAANYWQTNTPDVFTGVTEFQAFAAVPEPASLGLLAFGGLGLLGRRRRA